MTSKKIKKSHPLSLIKEEDEFGSYFEKNEVTKKMTLTVRKLKYAEKDLGIILKINERNLYLIDGQLCISYICEIYENHDFYSMSDYEITKSISEHLLNIDKKVDSFFDFTGDDDADGLDEFLDNQRDRFEFHKLAQDEVKVSRTTLSVNKYSDRKTEIHISEPILKTFSGYKCYSLTSKDKYEMKIKIFSMETGENIELCASNKFLGCLDSRERMHDIFKSGKVVDYDCSVYIGVASKKAHKYELNSID
ncbi:hypothetical protein AB6D09_023645 (plasmid) [Vibrio cyclitrophicus]